MRFDDDHPRAAPAHFPYDHPSLAWVWEQEEQLAAKHEAANNQAVRQAAQGEPETAPAPRKPLPRVTDAERLEMISAERAYERFMRGER